MRIFSLTIFLLFELWAFPALAGLPSAITGMQLWLDATDLKTVSDSAGKHPGEIGFNGRVKTWQDKSTYNRLAIAPDGRLPTYKAAGMNNVPTIEFGGDQSLDMATSINTSSETIVVVIRMYDSGDNRGPFIGSQSTAAAFMNDGNRYLLRLNLSQDMRANFPAPMTNKIVVGRRHGGLVDVFENGTKIIADQPDQNGALLQGTLTLNSVGSYQAGTKRYYYGVISEIIVYDRSLTEYEMADVGGYLGNKYAIPTTYANPPTRNRYLPWEILLRE